MKSFGVIGGARWLLILCCLIAAGCATNKGILLIEPGGTARSITPEEVDALSREEGPYLLQVGDQVRMNFETHALKAGEAPWDYRIEVGDRMEVRMSADVTDRSAYLIDVGDIVGVSFMNNWPLNANLSVRPDGAISLAGVGDVKAAGLTAEQLRSKLTQLYKKTGLIQGDPQINVNVDFSNVDRLENMSRDVTVRQDGAILLPGLSSSVRVAGMTIAEASDAIETEAGKVLKNRPVANLVLFPGLSTMLRNMNGTYEVRPDGQLSIPRLGEIQAAGYSLDEVLERVRAECRGILFNTVDPLADLAVATGSRIYVGGEVGIPGVYPLASTPTVLQAVLMAKGTRDTARLNNVHVVRRNPEGRPYVFRVNIRRALFRGYTENDIALEAFDIVYVPKKRVSRANLFVDQYIDGLVPFNNNLGVSMNYYLNEQDVNTKSRNRNGNLNIGQPFIPTTP